MEGSRHERAVTIAAAYVLGFTAAFILFSHGTSTSNLISLSGLDNSNVATVIESQSENTGDNLLTYSAGKLEINLPTGKRLLSINPDISKADVDFGSTEQGYHYGELKYNLSPDNKFVFFCERQFQEESSCFGFIYEIATDAVHQVRKESDYVTISLKSASGVSWSNDGLINIGSTISKSPTEPWVLVENYR